jgi:hypothetical protein
MFLHLCIRSEKASAVPLNVWLSEKSVHKSSLKPIRSPPMG